MGKLRAPEPHRLLIQTIDECLACHDVLVLDIGAGHAVEKQRQTKQWHLAKRYAALVRLPGYIALDAASEETPTIVADAHYLPFRDASVDVVLMISVLEHLHSPELAVGEAWRVLKQDGLFFSYAPFYHPYHASPHDYGRLTGEGYRYLLRAFRKVQLVSGGNYIAVLNDILTYGLRQCLGRGLVGKIGERLLFEWPLGLLFRIFDHRLSTKVAVGFGALARK
jgi:SAM-dependent methyltransferase